MKTMLPTIAMVVCCLGCASVPPGPAPNEPAVYATAADQALAAEWEALAAAETGDRARETINFTRTPENRDLLAEMRGEKAVSTERQLDKARAFVRNSMDAIRKTETWPDPPAYGVARATGAIAIDGKGSEPDWALAEAIPIRFPMAQTNAFDGPAATCRLLWDERNLYLLFDVSDTNIVSVCKNRDDAVSRNDCVEFFLLPSMRVGQYWEFNVSPAGVVYDALIGKYRDQYGGFLRVSENADLTVATLVDGTLNRAEDLDRGYAVEVAVPWSDLPGFQRCASAGDTLWAMLGWVDRVRPGRTKLTYYSHTPMLTNFHDIWGYSRLTLE